MMALSKLPQGVSEPFELGELILQLKHYLAYCHDRRHPNTSKPKW
jgi:hypothetical protein